MSEKTPRWLQGEAYILESGDVEIQPVSDEVWANRGSVREAFIEAWGKSSQHADGLDQLQLNDPSSLSDRGETVGEFLVRYGR